MYVFMYLCVYIVLAGNEVGLYNLNISLLEEYMYSESQRRQHNESSLQYTGKELAISRMYINNSTNPANVNIRQYSTANSSFKDSNSMGNSVDDVARREMFDTSLGISQKLASYRYYYFYDYKYKYYGGFTFIAF